MGNYDQMAAAVAEISGGKNVVLLDDLDKPSVYVPINRMKNSELLVGGSENIHPAFSVDTVEKTRYFYSKYQNVVINGHAYSLSHREPRTSINFDTAREACEAKGHGFHLATMAEWSAIALWCRKNGTMPHGNNNYGRDSAFPHERGQEAAREAIEGGYRTTRSFTGSGPSSWGHDWTQFGIQDMNGNVWEWLGGMRIVDGEIQVIPYNNAALGSQISMAAASTLWKAIKKDGTLVTPGSADTLHYDWINGKITLTAAVATSQEDTGRGTSYNSLALADGLVVPELAKALLIYPDEPNGDYGGDNHYMNPVGERLPIAGGGWSYGANAGVFSVWLGNRRSTAGGSVGFRSAYCEL